MSDDGLVLALPYINRRVEHASWCLVWTEDGQTYYHSDDGHYVPRATPTPPEEWAAQYDWQIKPRYSAIPHWLHCAECDEISFLDYLCPRCRMSA